MTLYKCGHTRDTIILDDNIISYSAYLDWAESVGINGTKELCWDCWNEKNCKVKEDKDLEIKIKDDVEEIIEHNGRKYKLINELSSKQEVSNG
jgi:hypothetical protein